MISDDTRTPYAQTSAWVDLVAKVAGLRTRAKGLSDAFDVDDMLSLSSALDAAVTAGAPRAVACAAVLGPEAAEALAEVDDLLATIGAAMSSCFLHGTRAAAPESLGVASQPSLRELAAALVSPIDATDFEQAFTAGLEEARRDAAGLPDGPRRQLETHIAVAAAGAHMIPGGKAAVDSYLARRRGASDTKRFAARVRSWLGRMSRAQVPAAAPRASAQRPRARGRSSAGASQARAGPTDPPPPAQDPEPPGHAKGPRALHVESSLGSSSTVRPWEREILLPFASRLLAALMSGEDDGTTKE